MAGKLAFHRPTREDVNYLALHMRDDDRRELEAAQGHTGTAIELDGYVKASVDAWACEAPQGFMCLFGTARAGTLLSPIGVIWMLGTPVVTRNASNLIRSTRAYLTEMRKDFPLLTNFIDARNEASLRYMRACGATIHEAEPHGVAGLPFHRFTLGA